MATAQKTAAPSEPTTVALSEVATLDPGLRAQVVAVVNAARYATFSTGSDGFRSVGKVANEHGHRYQVSVQLVRIGSKDRRAV